MAIAVLRRMPIRTSRLISISNPISNALGAGCDGNGDSLPSSERSSRDWMPLPQGLGGICQSNVITVIRPSKYTHPMCSLMVGACFSSEATKEGGAPTAAVVEVYEKMVKSLEARTMPPNAWLWSLIGSCSNQDDIKLLFQMLQKLRIFRLSNLRIHDNFNCHLCMRVTEACARASALDYGLKALWKHNVYGLTPSIGSAHYLLSYAKEHNDAKLMVKVMRTMQMNSLPLQPGTADIVFSICYNTNRWDLISKYAKKFMKVGVKLHRNAFGIWMEFAAKIGDVQTLWNIEKERSKSMKGHTLATGFSCAKGHLLQRKTRKAATVIQLLYQNLPDHKKPGVADELQKLVSEWALEVVKKQKKEDRQALADSLKNDIPAMISYLTTLGLEVPVKLESPEMLNW